jgi:hypothetical protein
LQRFGFSAPAVKACSNSSAAADIKYPRFSILAQFCQLPCLVHVFICVHTNKIGRFLTRRSTFAGVRAAVIPSKINFVPSRLTFKCTIFVALLMCNVFLNVLLYTTVVPKLCAAAP